MDLKYNNTILTLNNVPTINDVTNSNIFTSKLENCDIYSNEFDTLNLRNGLTETITRIDGTLFNSVLNRVQSNYVHMILNKSPIISFRKRKRSLSIFQ